MMTTLPEKKVAGISEATGAVRKGTESMAVVNQERQNAIKNAVSSRCTVGK